MEASDFPLPSGHEDKSDGFARAYAHARSHGNGEKAALQFADAWAEDFEYDGSDERTGRNA